ncbi:uncharacterized protein KD926_008232 [Aspergillus affinis]|uniref:uncharacterized protein n=1 Tax=Aspergillus affinis TaxID=1070780 RepID=UPI0022FEF678|nr:uncharacterized protein KD926_008232 [Aspergillus affinis]KAI9040409.1 hypothetical protein KD926_008232 [Aspergillus affinis]
MFSSDFTYNLPEASMSNESLDYLPFNPQKLSDFQTSPFKPAQVIATEQAMNQWPDIQGPSPTANSRISQGGRLENGFQRTGNGRSQPISPMVESSDDLTIGELRHMKKRYDQIDMRMDTIMENLKHLMAHANRVGNFAERIHQLDTLSSQLENIRANTKRLDRQLNENCEEMRREVKRIDRMVETYEYIQKKFQGLLCRLSRRRSADDCRAAPGEEELLV